MAYQLFSSNNNIGRNKRCEALSFVFLCRKADEAFTNCHFKYSQYEKSIIY